MRKILASFAVLLLLVIGAAGYAQAQDYNDGGAPSQSDAAPVNPARHVYENGAVLVIIDSPRDYGYRIGDPIPMRVIFITDKNVSLNLDNLVSGNFDPVNGSDFRLVAVDAVTRVQQNGKNVTLVQLRVRTWVPKPSITFNAVFGYSVSETQDGSPKWTPAATPDFTITRSATVADNSKDLDQGDVSLRSSPHPKPVTPMRVAGGLLALLLAGFLLQKLYRRLFPSRELAADVIAWSVFDKVLLESDASVGISRENAERVAAALRRYLKVEALTDKEMQPALEGFFVNEAKRYELVRVAQEAFVALDGAIYPRPDGSVGLTPQAARDLFARIERIVPHP